MITALKTWFFTWWFYAKLTAEGCYYYIMYRGLQLWYFVFTPKHAQYIEDVYLLDKYNRKLQLWKLTATASIFIKGLKFT